MHVALVHGYFLHDSGSGIYVRELARAFVRLGHDVTLVCQERAPERTDFIDAAYVLDPTNSTLARVYEAPRRYAGSCRLVRPAIGDELLVYVDGEFPGFARDRVVAFQSASQAQLDRYVAANVEALRTVFARWRPDVVLAQHLIMQPFVANAALADRSPYVVTEHGSALNFSVRHSEALLPFALDGLDGAVAVATVSVPARDDLIAWAGEHRLDISGKTVELPPGVDAETFACPVDRTAALERLRTLVDLPPGFDIAPDDDVLVFAGSVRNTKGVQHLVAALPLVEQRRGRRLRLLIAGDGPARPELERLAVRVEAGDGAAARETVARSSDLQSEERWGEVVVDAPPMRCASSIAFLGHVDHVQLAAVFAAADVMVVPSVFPEAAALVGIEALMTGALPLVAYHSGLQVLGDLLAETLGDAAFTSLVADGRLTSRLADTVPALLERYPTRDPAFRAMLRESALRRYPTWGDTANAYLELAGVGTSTAAPTRGTPAGSG